MQINVRAILTGKEFPVILLTETKTRLLCIIRDEVIYLEKKYFVKEAI